MGKAAARQLADAGLPLIILVREGQKGRDAHAEIVQLSGNRAVEIETADLSSMAETRAAAGRILERYPRIAGFIGNAGAHFAERRLTREGIERTLAVNCLSPFLLTHLLFGALQAHAAGAGNHARVVLTASAMQIPFERDDYNRERGYDGWQVYGQTKFANVQFTLALARRLEGTGITANCLAPGFVRTDIFRHNPAPMQWLLAATGRLFMTSPERAGSYIARLATDPALTETNGIYFDRTKPRRANEAAYDEASQDQLWSLSERLTGLLDPS
ncbi:NAD(P)-dependent dehydrogenase, short-chain alcohol dehydrogenase family [Devosia limi DSM 17137]|nr:NAD(P)-dependent dehydrogenase, short-chain alcohol dehydrogenase family [Devosia limi DSM 17137]